MYVASAMLKSGKGKEIMSVYKDEKLKPIFDRREEIRKECNKLMDEYQALEYILKENRRLKEENEKLKKKSERNRE